MTRLPFLMFLSPGMVTDRYVRTYVPFISHHHLKTITWVMRGMRDRTHRVCDPSSKPKELQHLDEVLQANGFSTHLVKKALAASPKVPHTEDLELTNHEGPYTPFTSVDSARDSKGYVLPSTSAMSSPQLRSTLKRILMRVKSWGPEEKKKGMRECGSTLYVGMAREMAPLL